MLFAAQDEEIKAKAEARSGLENYLYRWVQLSLALKHFASP